MQEEKKIEERLRPFLMEKGYELVSITYHTHGKDGPNLEIVVDRVKPISLNEIVALSEEISSKIDEDDPFPNAYTLDISSLGAEKPIALEKLDAYLDSYVSLHLSHPYKGENFLEGRIKEINEDSLTLLIKQKAKKIPITLERKNIDRARLAIEL